MYLSSLFKESLTVSSEGFLEVLGDAIEMLEKEKGKLGNLTFQDRIVKIEPKGDALIIGDLHGNLESLKTVLEKSGFLKRLAHQSDANLIFLGDYGDRGAYSVEVYYVILSLKLAYPKQVILLRGNHEAPKSSMAYPHDLPIQLQLHFQNDWQVIYNILLGSLIYSTTLFMLKVDT